MKEAKHSLLYKLNYLEYFIDELDPELQPRQKEVLNRIRQLVENESIDSMLAAESIFFHCLEMVEEKADVNSQISQMLTFML